MKHSSQRTVLKLGLDKCFIKKVINLVILNSALSLELVFLLYLKHVYQTSICCLLRLQVVLWNDLALFYQGQLSPKRAQIYLRPQKDDTYQYSISYSYSETMLSLIEQELPLDLDHRQKKLCHRQNYKHSLRIK